MLTCLKVLIVSKGCVKTVQSDPAIDPDKNEFMNFFRLLLSTKSFFESKKRLHPLIQRPI